MGEENILRSTFSEFFRKIFDSKYRIESMNQQMEYILSGNCNKNRLLSIRFKASLQFLTILQKYVQHLENGMSLHFKKLVYNQTQVISAEDIYVLFRNDYSFFPYAKRLEKLCQRLFYLLEQCEEKRVAELQESELQEGHLITEEEKKSAERKVKIEYESLKNDIIQMTSFDILWLYSNLFRNIEFFAQTTDKQELEGLSNLGVYTISQLSKDIINYEDIAPIIYLKTILDTVSDTKSIKHVIIDEAQDYTVVHYEIFKKVFAHCNMTILGDVNQAVNGYMNIGSFDNILDIFNSKDTKNISLTKSYRSSKEIADFCKKILMSSNNTEQLNRHGNKPKVIKSDKSNLYRRIAEDINMLKKRNHKLIAVICKTAGQCEALYETVKSYVDINLISNKNEEYQGGAVIIPSYLAKGLEFDAVLVGSVEEEEYSEAEDRRLLYTVCTRALHELHLYYSDNMSGFIKNINEEYYTND